MLHLTIGLFLYLHYFKRFLKRLLIIEFITILTIITFLLMNNLVSGIINSNPNLHGTLESNYVLVLNDVNFLSRQLKKLRNKTGVHSH